MKSTREKVEEVLLGRMFTREECVAQIMKLFRKDVRRGYAKGHEHAYLGYHEGREHESERSAVNLILNGPKRKAGKK